MGQTRSMHGRGWKCIQDFSRNISKNEAVSRRPTSKRENNIRFKRSWHLVSLMYS